MAIQVFLDDSGTKGTRKVLLVGGLLGSVEAMTDLAERWDRELRARLPLPIRYFKAHEARHLTGEFNFWRAEARDEKVARLAAVLDRDDAVMLFGGVTLPAHRQTEQVFGPVTDAKHHPLNQPYLMALYGAVMAAAMEARRLREPAEIVVDEHHVFAGVVREQYPVLVEQLPEWLREFLPPRVLFRDDLEVVALQASDLLMGHARMRAEGVGVESWPDIDLRTLRASPFARFLGAQALGEMAARHTERRLGWPQGAIRVGVLPSESGDRI